MYIVYQLWCNLLVFALAVNLAPGISIKNDSLTDYLISGLIYSVMILLIPRIIEFLKLNVNLVSFILVGSLFSMGYFYIMRYVLVGFITYEEFSSSKAVLGLAFLKGFAMNETGVIVFAGIFTIILAAIHQWLMEK